MTRARTLLGLLAAALLGGAVPAAAQPAPGSPAPLGYAAYGAAAAVCTPTDRRLDSISGMAVSRGALWVQADRTGELWQLDRGCAPVRRADLRAAGRPTDTEDLAVSADGALWIADTGGNRASRRTVSVLKVPTRGVPVRHTLSYPDGPHDAETLLVSPDGTQLLLLTKVASGVSTVFAPVAPIRPGGSVALRAVGTARASGLVGRNPGASALLFTGGAVSPDGLHLVLRTYNDAWEYDAPDGRLADALRGLPRKVTLPESKQGEAVAYAADGKSFLVGGEQLGTVYRISIDRPRYAPTGAPAAAVDPHDRSVVAAVIAGGGLACLLLLVGAVVVERRRSRRRSVLEPAAGRALPALLRNR